MCWCIPFRGCTASSEVVRFLIFRACAFHASFTQQVKITVFRRSVRVLEYPIIPSFWITVIYLVTGTSREIRSMNSSPPHLIWDPWRVLSCFPPWLFFWSTVLRLSSSWNHNGAEEWPFLKLMTRLPYHFVIEGGWMTIEWISSKCAHIAYRDCLFSGRSFGDGIMMVLASVDHSIQVVTDGGYQSIQLPSSLSSGLLSTCTNASKSFETINVSGVQAIRYSCIVCWKENSLSPALSLLILRTRSLLPRTSCCCCFSYLPFRQLKYNRI